MSSEPVMRQGKDALLILKNIKRAPIPIWHRIHMIAVQLLGIKVGILSWCLTLIICLGLNHAALAQKSSQLKTIGSKTYSVQLLVEEKFENLDNWMIETKNPRSVKVRNNILQWDARGSMGTIWYKRLVRGPSMIEYDVQNIDGKNNINAIFYGSIIKKGKEVLLETTHQRTGAYRDYHTFPNYIVTYLSQDPSTNVRTWRIRFRKDPGFNLLSEQIVDKRVNSGTWQRLTYVFESKGRMSLYVDNQLVHTERDKKDPYRIGYHALRTWNTRLQYKNFKIYQIVSPLSPTPVTLQPPKKLHVIETR